MRVSVIGGGTVDPPTADRAEALGRLLAEHGHTVVCGGLGGAMEAACRGAQAAGGHTIGILPGEDRTAANPHVDTAIATGLGHARNALVVMNGDAVVALDGGHGTRTELGYAGVYNRPVAALGSHDVEGVQSVDSVEEAIEYVERTRKG